MTDLIKDVLRGFLHFYSEDSTNGGYWAFQDERFITPNTTHYVCKKCNLYWDEATESMEDVLEKGKRRSRSTANCTHEFSLISPDDWSRDGHHTLKNGDLLKIFSKENPEQVVWEGIIKLHQYDLFTKHIRGFWLHADQVGIDREKWSTWFFARNSAELSVV